ncbi:MAG: toxin-antitoxin system YwqK family antitoxin [Bacteroidota bacterium]
MANKCFIILFAPFVLILSGCNTYNRVFKGEEYYQNITVTRDDSIIQAHAITKDIDIKPNENTLYFWYIPNEIHWNEGGYTGNLLHGEYLLLDRDKNLLMEGYFNKGVKSKQWKQWYANGDLQSITEYKNGKKDGMHKIYSQNGDTILKEHYKKGVKHGKQTLSTQDTIITEVYKYGEKSEKRQRGFFLFRWIGNIFSGKNKTEKPRHEKTEEEKTEQEGEEEQQNIPSPEDYDNRKRIRDTF